jgi:hypothetical protein
MTVPRSARPGPTSTAMGVTPATTSSAAISRPTSCGREPTAVFSCPAPFKTPTPRPPSGSSAARTAGKEETTRLPATAAVQIDHVVALSDAWQKGAQQLSADTRRVFANDSLNLLAVDGPTNQGKSDGDAATWLPPSKPYRCPYVARQVAVKAKYGLWVTGAERDAIARILSTCPMQALPTAAGFVLGAGR